MVITRGNLRVSVKVLQDILVNSHANPSDNCEIALSHHYRRNSEIHNRVKSREVSCVVHRRLKGEYRRVDTVLSQVEELQRTDLRTFIDIIIEKNSSERNY